MRQKPIYTESENCQDCYKCIRECPVKAIRIESNKAYIIDERCIYCGHCTLICPTGAKKIRNGIPFAKNILQENSKVILSLAPSYVSEFHDIPLASLISAIKKLGFTGVSETALGAELVSNKVSEYLNKADSGIYISSACPVIMEYISKYEHPYISNITPVFSPLLAHTKMLKHLYGKDVKIIFAGPCIGKKLEADAHSDLLGVAITFQDLKKWFEEENIDLKEYSSTEETVIPYHAGISTLYPIEGGMLPGIQPKERKVVKMAFSGMEHIKEVLCQLEAQPQKDVLFLELLACKGGCINGPGKLSYCSPALKRYDISDKTDYEQNNKIFEEIDLTLHYQKDKRIKIEEFSDDEILEALGRVGKTCVADELNCSGCGYDSCQDFAKALLAGRAEENMCLSYMRKVAHDKATALLQKIPIGVFIVDGDMKIVDMNLAGAKTLGEDIETIYEVSPGLRGIELEKICPFSDVFHAALTTGEEIIEKLFQEEDKIWLISIYNIQPQRLVFGLIQDFRESYGQNEWMMQKTEEVIRKNMETVRQIACLLGENAAYTDSTLTALKEILKTSK